MPAHLDQVLQGLPQTDISSSHTGASKRPQGMDRDGHQKEALSCRSCTDMPHATTQGWVLSCHDLLKLLARAVGVKPQQRGR